jgi:hypothetical protein
MRRCLVALAAVILCRSSVEASRLRDFSPGMHCETSRGIVPADELNKIRHLHVKQQCGTSCRAFFLDNVEPQFTEEVLP